MAWRQVSRLALCSALTAVSLLGGACAQQQAQAPAAPLHKQLEVPVITPQRQTDPRQVKGGLEITIAPVSYETKTVTQTTLQQGQPSFGQELMGGHQGEVFVNETTKTSVKVEPDQLCFLVTVNNKMPRVFHGAGTVVQFNVGGSVMAVNEAGYRNLQGAIVPPQQQQQFRIYGPALSELQQKSGTLGVFLYDVVTNQNAAGVVTEKQNYEWYFDYTMAPRDVQVTPDVTRGQYMTIPAYQQAMTQQQMQQMQRSYPPGMMPPQGRPYGPPPQQ